MSSNNIFPSVATAIFSSIVCHSAFGQTEIVVRPGPDQYGFSAWWNNGEIGEYSQDAQSFVATGSLLSRVSIYVRAQTDPDISWQYQLWNDNAGSPHSVIAEFGSFRASIEYELFDVVLNNPIPIEIGGRYYLGLAPELSSAPLTGIGLAAILVRGFRETAIQDAYAAGTVWAIRNPGTAGEYLRQPNNFDFSMSISIVPEPSVYLLFIFGSLALGMLHRTTASKNGRE